MTGRRDELLGVLTPRQEERVREIVRDEMAALASENHTLRRQLYDAAYDRWDAERRDRQRSIFHHQV